MREETHGEQRGLLSEGDVGDKKEERMRGGRIKTREKDDARNSSVYTDYRKGSCDKAAGQQEEPLPVMKGKRWKKGRKRRREIGRYVTGR